MTKQLCRALERATDDWDDRLLGPKPPDVQCKECRGTMFRLRYGEYSLEGKCVSCGCEQEVYSG